MVVFYTISAMLDHTSGFPKYHRMGGLQITNLFLIILEAEKFQDPGAGIVAFILRSLVLAFRQSPSHRVLI